MQEPRKPFDAFNVRLVASVKDEEREFWKAAYCAALSGAAGAPDGFDPNTQATRIANIAVADFRLKFDPQ
jgi:hypothetical protein